jgi:hypothetical protein
MMGIKPKLKDETNEYITNSVVVYNIQLWGR